MKSLADPSRRNRSRHIKDDVQTARKYYRELGGIRIGRRYLFFEEEVYNAHTRGTKYIGQSRRNGQRKEKIFKTRKQLKPGNGDAEEVRRRLVREDRHDLFG